MCVRRSPHTLARPRAQLVTSPPTSLLLPLLLVRLPAAKGGRGGRGGKQPAGKQAGKGGRKAGGGGGDEEEEDEGDAATTAALAEAFSKGVGTGGGADGAGGQPPECKQQ